MRSNTCFETSNSKEGKCLSPSANSHTTYKMTQLMFGYDKLIY